MTSQLSLAGVVIWIRTKKAMQKMEKNRQHWASSLVQGMLVPSIVGSRNSLLNTAYFRMSLDFESMLRHKLSCLLPTQESINTLSGDIQLRCARVRDAVFFVEWVMFHESKHERAVSVWLAELYTVPTFQKINLFYLCNDILQKSRVKFCICLTLIKGDVL